MVDANIKFVVVSGNQYYQLISFFDNPEQMSFVVENGALIIHQAKELFAIEIDRCVWLSAINTIMLMDAIEFVLVNGLKILILPIQQIKKISNFTKTISHALKK